MNSPTFLRIGFGLLLTLLSVAGCYRSSAPPAPLPVEQMPAALEQAFSQAQPEPKELANEVAASVKAQDYAKALVELKLLGGTPQLTREQAGVTTRGLLTLNTLLQAAQGRGDEKAAAVLKYQRLTK